MVGSQWGGGGAIGTGRFFFTLNFAIILLSSSYLLVSYATLCKMHQQFFCIDIMTLTPQALRLQIANHAAHLIRSGEASTSAEAQRLAEVFFAIELDSIAPLNKVIPGGAGGPL